MRGGSNQKFAQAFSVSSLFMSSIGLSGIDSGSMYRAFFLVRAVPKCIKRIETPRYVLYTLNDQYHRDDGPAVLYDNGNYMYYQHGIVHRVGGPTIMELPTATQTGIEVWRVHGILHREGGPARTWTRLDGIKQMEYFENGTLLRRVIYDPPV